VIQLAAWNTIEVIASAEQAAAFDATGLVRAEIVESPDRWRLQAGSRVGVAVGGDWELRVVPRIEIAQLMFLLSYARAEGWRSQVADYDDDETLFAAIASGFASHAEGAIRPAPLSGYVSVDETAPMLRGRLRITDQMSRRPAMPLPLEITYDDFTPDIPENRLILGAAEVLLRFPLVPARTRSRLLRIRAALDGVAATRSSASVRVPPATRLNERYTTALALAQLILEGNGISTAMGGIASTTFSFDMNTVFEDFLTRALADAVAQSGARVVPQDEGRYLDVERTLRLKPDITIWRHSSCVAVLDAKYKPLTTPSFPNADAYQMLAYCTAYGLDRGTLVYAKDALGGERTHRVEAPGISIDVRALDVTRPHGEVLAQVDALASLILGSEAGVQIAA
jgi:5-methylcytosine-specific restriction enzyme subunit McrC